MRSDEIGDYTPQIRPHYERRGQQLFFLISRRPTLDLSPEEVGIYDSIDGCKTVFELERTYTRIRDLLLRWHDAGIVELIPPIIPPNAPHLVVIEPHMDDAVLSAGGRLLSRRGRCRITILSLVRWSNFTSYLLQKRDFLNVRVITDLRLKESALATRLLGAEHRCMDWTDVLLRFLPTEQWSLEMVDRFLEAHDAFLRLAPDTREVKMLAEQLANEVGLLVPDELWIPMGLGDHVDHRTTRSACIRMLAETRGLYSNIPVLMYEDLPYANRAQAAQIQEAFAACGTRLVRGMEDITNVFEEKLRVISVYGSQFKLSAMASRLRESARRAAGSRGESLAEVYYRIEGEPRLPPESDLSPDWAGLAVLRVKMQPLIEKRHRFRRLTVIALPSAHLGRWTADHERILAAFPNANLRVYVSKDVAWQIGEAWDDRLDVQVVRKGLRGWVGVVLCELMRFGTLTIVLWWGSYRVEGGLKRKFMKSILPLRTALFAKSLGDVCTLLDEQRGIP